MLAGEYSVLKGFPALASTVASQLTIDIKAQDSDYCHVTSHVWQQPKLLYPKSRYTPKNMLLRCVWDAIRYFACSQNFSLEVSSHFKIAHGIGSSSALRIGVFLALEAYTGKRQSKDDLLAFCLEQQRLFQSKASGYDVATQAHGGTISYQLQDNAAEIHSLQHHAYEHFLCLVNNAGAPTNEMMLSMQDFLASNTDWATEFDKLNLKLFTDLKAFMEKVCAAGKVLDSIKTFRKHTEASPMFVKQLAHMQGMGLDKDWSFKTTGAGGEDAILVFSKLPLTMERKTNILNAFKPRGFVEAPFQLADSKPKVKTLGNFA